MRYRRFFTGFLVVLPSLALVAGLIGVSLVAGDGTATATEEVATAAESRPNISLGDAAAEARLIRESLAKIAADRRAAELAAAQEAAAQEAAAVKAAAERRAAERAAARQAAADRRAAERVSRDAVRTPAPVQAAAADDVWAKLRNCEAGGRYDRNSGNGYYGAYQFAAGTWRSLGYPGLPHAAPPEMQDVAAKRLQARGGWGQWPACSRRVGAR